MKIKRIALKIISYLITFLIPIIFPIVKWSCISPLFGKRVDLGKSIDLIAAKDNIALKDSARISQHRIEIPTKQMKHSPKIIISQEYPSSQGFGYQQSIDLNKYPAVMTYKADWQEFWLGVNNVDPRVRNLVNPILFLDFQGKVKVKLDREKSEDWLETDPNFTYLIKMNNSSIQPGQGFRLNPIFVKFDKEGVYNVSYSVTADNELPMSGNFDIKVAK